MHPILVTGASRGIGAALTALCAAEGRPVIAVARHFAEPPAPGVARITADLTDPADIVRIAASVETPLHALINNAGIQQALDFATLTPVEADREIALNLAAPLHLTCALLPRLPRGASVVNVTSLLARQPKPSAPVYSASKAGLASLTRSMRHQLSPLGINVIEALPPLVDTEMTAGRGKAKMPPEAMAQAILDGMAKGRRTIAPGPARPVLILNRLFPELVARILSRA